MAWLPATGIAGSAVVTLASCRIWIAHWKTVGYWPWESSPTYRYLMAIQLRTSVTRKGFMQSGIAASRPQDQSRCSHPELTLTSTSNRCTSHTFTVPCEPRIEFAAVHESGSGTKQRWRMTPNSSALECKPAVVFGRAPNHITGYMAPHNSRAYAMLG